MRTKSVTKLSNVFTKIKAAFTYLKRSDIAEALIATWALEFLRVRRLGGFHIVEIIIISTLMLGVKAIVTEAGRRRHNVRNRSYDMPDGYPFMEPMEIGKYTARTSNRSRRSRFTRRRPERRDAYS